MASASSMAELEKEMATKVGGEREEEEEKSIYVNVLAPASSNPARGTTKCSQSLTAASSATSGPWIYVILGERDEMFEQREPWGYVFHAEQKYEAYPLNPPPDAPSNDDPYDIVGYKDSILVHMPKDNRLYFHESLTHRWCLYYDGDVAYRGYEFSDAYVLSDYVLYFYDAGDVPRLSAFDLVQRKHFSPLDPPSALCFAYDANVNLLAVAKDKLCMPCWGCHPCFNGIEVYCTKFSVSRDDSSFHVVVEEDQSFLIEAYCIVNCVAL